MSILSSIARLLGKQNISSEEILQVLRNHEGRLSEVERKLDDVASEIISRFNELSKRGLAAKKQATKDLEKLRSELDALIGAVDVVVSGELAPQRNREIRNLIKTAKGSRTRIQKVLETRAN